MINDTITGILFYVWVTVMVVLFLYLGVRGVRNHNTLVRMPCPTCRRPFGKKAVAKALKLLESKVAIEQQRMAWEDDIFGRNPPSRFKGGWPIECPECGFKARYLGMERGLQPLDEK